MVSTFRKAVGMGLTALLCAALIPFAPAGADQAWADGEQTEASATVEQEQSTPVQEYNITYVLNGGVNSSSNPTTYSGKVTLKKPTKAGYTFKGWYADKKFKKKVKTVSNKNIKVYAKWAKKTYKIKYVLSGGKNAKANKTKYTVTTKTFKLKAPTRKGYTFKGWYLDKNHTKRVTKIKKGSTGSITLYAKWEKPKSAWTSGIAARVMSNMEKAMTCWNDAATNYKYGASIYTTATYRYRAFRDAVSDLRKCRYWLVSAQYIVNDMKPYTSGGYNLADEVNAAAAEISNLDYFNGMSTGNYLTYAVELGVRMRECGIHLVNAGDLSGALWLKLQ